MLTKTKTLTCLRRRPSKHRDRTSCLRRRPSETRDEQHAHEDGMALRPNTSFFIVGTPTLLGINIKPLGLEKQLPKRVNVPTTIPMQPSPRRAHTHTNTQSSLTKTKLFAAAFQAFTNMPMKPLINCKHRNHCTRLRAKGDKAWVAQTRTESSTADHHCLASARTGSSDGHAGGPPG